MGLSTISIVMIPHLLLQRTGGGSAKYGLWRNTVYVSIVRFPRLGKLLITPQTFTISHVTPLLHDLSVDFHMQFKVLVITFKILHDIGQITYGTILIYLPILMISPHFTGSGRMGIQWWIHWWNNVKILAIGSMPSCHLHNGTAFPPEIWMILTQLAFRKALKTWLFPHVESVYTVDRLGMGWFVYMCEHYNGFRVVYCFKLPF